MQFRPLEVTDFSGGVTDNFIDGTTDQAEVFDNLLINSNKKPITRPGTWPYVEEQIPIGLFRVSYITDVVGTLLTFAQRRVYYENSGSWGEILGPDAVSPLLPSGDANTILSVTGWQDHVFVASDGFTSIQKIYKDNLGVWQLRNAGLPEYPTGTNITLGAGGQSFLYAFCFKYTYNVGDVTFIDRGPITYYPSTVQGSAINGGNPAVITLIPNSIPTVENWDTANIEKEIYRTANGETDFYLVTTLPFATTSYNDTTDDATLITNLPMYANGGRYSNDTPPKAKYIHVVGNIGYYGHVIDGSDTQKFKIMQSIPGDIDSVPLEFFSETDEEIYGVSSIFDRPIVLCERKIYRIDNVIDSFGVGDMDLRTIDDRAGCVSSNSIVQTQKGLFWAGQNGFYWSDGLQVRHISRHLNKTYPSFVENSTRQSRIVGTYDKAGDRVIWTIGKNGDECDTLYVLDLNWKHVGHPEMVFTTASGGSDNPSNFSPSSVHVYRDKLYSGDSRGYLLEHSENYLNDAKIDTSVSPSNWEESTIIYRLSTCFLDFGSKFFRKFVPRILISASNETDLSLEILSSNDNNRVQGTLQPIEYKSNVTWGSSLPAWGTSSVKWNFQGLIEEWRRFPAKGLRCNYKQVTFTNAISDIIDSSVLGTVTVNQTAKTAVLGGSFTWFSGIIDYYIAFENDNYEELFLITASTSNTVTFLDPSSKTPIDGVYNFKVKGKPKNERFNLLGYVLHWVNLSKSHQPYTAGE